MACSPLWSCRLLQYQFTSFFGRLQYFYGAVMVWNRYCSLVNKSSEKRAAYGVLFTPSLHKIVSELVGAWSVTWEQRLTYRVRFYIYFRAWWSGKLGILLRTGRRYDIRRAQTGKEACFIGNTRQYTMASCILLRRGTGIAGIQEIPDLWAGA